MKWTTVRPFPCLLVKQGALKGQSHEIIVDGFFNYKTALPGPIGDVLGPFRFFDFWLSI